MTVGDDNPRVAGAERPLPAAVATPSNALPRQRGQLVAGACAITDATAAVRTMTDMASVECGRTAGY